jgi:hypothetical protein
MRTKIGCFSLWVAISIYGSVASAQGTPNMQVQLNPSPSSAIVLAAATPALLPDFPSSVVAQFHPSTFLLTDQDPSGRAIVALAVQWVYTDNSGHQGEDSLRSDKYLRQTPNVLLPPSASLLVAPGVFLQKALALGPHIGSPLQALDGHGSSWAATASKITITVDCVIFEDGEVVGPNNSHLDLEIQSRKIAAGKLAKQVRSVQSAGGDPTPVLKQLAATSSDSDFVILWTSILASRLLNAPVLNTQLAALENMPALPNFFTK